MAYYLLHDRDAERAVLFDSVSERPLNHEAFSGPEAREHGESFVKWLMANPPHVHDLGDGDLYFSGYGTADISDPRCYTAKGLDKAIDQWRAECLTENGDLTATGEAFVAAFNS